MTNEEANAWIDKWWAETPEAKLELIDGRLIISTVAGSRRILWTLLRDYGPPMALPWAPRELWWEALAQAFDPQPRSRTPEEWTAWAAGFEYDPEPAPAGPYGTIEHRHVFDVLQSGLSYFCGVSGLGTSLGRDFVIRLGENAFTPDLIFIDHARLANMHEYYLDGPPAIAIEILLEGHAEQERGPKLRFYEEAGIPEYWLFESATQDSVFLRLGSDGRYSPAAPDEHGIYRSAAVPGLALSLPDLWTMEDNWSRDGRPFLPPIHREDRSPRERRRDPDELRWDSLPYAPRLELQPVPIRFEEFVSWCPRAKFEDIGGLWIGGSEGSRRCLGMLLMTFGLVEAVKLATPRDWVTFLHPEPYLALVEKHTAALMAQAEYKPDRWGDEEYVYGKIFDISGPSAVGDDLEECRRELEKAVRDRVLLRIARGQDPEGAGRCHPAPAAAG